ncbi:MAG: FAD:protein FMN transferase [Gemmatimonadota bacterium]
MDVLLSRRRRALLAGAVGAAALAAWNRSAPTGALHMSGETMGTSYNVKIAGHRIDDEARSALHEAVHAAFDRVNRGMSLYRADSELARFNRQQADTAFAMSSEMFDVFAAAMSVSELTGGAFDVTVAPLVASWGFGPDRRQAIPSPDALRAQRAAVDFRALRLDAAERTVTKSRLPLTADLNGIAKGYGVDLAARALEVRGIDNYLVEAGGEVRARGVNADGRPWQIGIEQPDSVPQRARYISPVVNGAVATSGDYRIFIERDGRRYCHEIDPVRGTPIEHGLASVSVVASDCVRADALATALIVLGLEHGYALAESRGIAAYFIQRRDGGLQDRMTTAFAALGGQRATEG